MNPSLEEAPSILIFAPAFLPGFKAGGPIKSVAWTLESLDVGRALLITRDRDLGDSGPYPGLSGTTQPYAGHDVFYWDQRSLRQTAQVLRAISRRRWDAVYVNSYWSPRYSLLPALLRLGGLLRAKHFMVAPRGELASAALAIKSRKKHLLGTAYGLVYRANRTTFHSTASHELDAIKVRHTWARTVSAPAGQLAPVTDPRRSPRDRPRIVYLSRVSVIKNTHLFAEAVRHLDRPCDVDIYGPIEDQAYWSECLKHLGAADDRTKISYHGPLKSEHVRPTLLDANIFVLPTSGENHGHAIAEALSAGCAVAVPDTTPWTNVIREGGGVIIQDLTGADVQRAIEALMASWSMAPQDQSARVLHAYGQWFALHQARNAVEVLLCDDPVAGESTE